MGVLILNQCKREIEKLPLTVREDLADALARLNEGLMLTMPLSRPMPNIGLAVHELRLADRSGIYRVIYVLDRTQITVAHAFKKTEQRTPRQTINLVRQRIRSIKL